MYTDHLKTWSISSNIINCLHCQREWENQILIHLNKKHNRFTEPVRVHSTISYKLSTAIHNTNTCKTDFLIYRKSEGKCYDSSCVYFDATDTASTGPPNGTGTVGNMASV